MLFNNSLAVGELPKEWKQGRISAIFKKGNRKNAGNYRPVSLTSIICKCMEQCVKDHIVNHMIRNKLVCKNLVLLKVDLRYSNY